MVTADNHEIVAIILNCLTNFFTFRISQDYRFFAIVEPAIRRANNNIGSRVKGSAFGYPVNCCCAVGGLKSPVTYVYAFVGWVL